MFSLDTVYASALAAVLCILGYLHRRWTQDREVLQQYMPIQNLSSTRQVSVLV